MKSTSPTAARIKSFGRWTYRYRFLIAILFLIAVYIVEYVEAGVLPANAAYTIANSARFVSGNNDYLTRTPSATGNQKTFTLSFWIKRSSLGRQELVNPFFGNNNRYCDFEFNSGDTLETECGLYSTSPTTNSFDLVTSAVFRDPAAWLQIVIAVDTTQPTAANRVKIYVNGTQITSFSTATYPSQNDNTFFNVSTTPLNIGLFSTLGLNLDAYLSDFYEIDGQQLTPSSFGAYDSNGYWRPIAYTGSYGTDGFHLNFSNGASLGTDSSNNGNNFTVNGLTSTDQVLDSPTNSFETFSPVYPGAQTLNSGNLNVTTGRVNVGTMPINSGKWYWEVTTAASNSSGFPVYGLYTSNLGVIDGYPATNSSNDSGVGAEPLPTVPRVDLLVDGATAITGISGATPYAANDVIMFALDANTGKYWMGQNGTWWASGNPAAGTNPLTTLSGRTFFVPGAAPQGSGTSKFNFGQGGLSGLTFDAASGGDFKYTPPAGFKALDTANLSVPAIAQPNKYFDATTSVATGATKTIVLPGAFQPDLVVSKDRSTATNGRWGWIDSLRGVNKTFSSQIPDAEVTSQSDLLTAFNTNGFTVGADAAAYGWNFNQTGSDQYVYWAWKKSTTDGFDIETYTGNGTATQTIAQNLGAAPEMIIVKRRDSSGDPYVWAKGFTDQTYFGLLDSQNAQTNTNTPWGSSITANFTSSSFTVSDNATNNANASGGTYVAYLFRGIAGFSQFGGYTGNGSADGPFIYTGFKPRFVMIKDATTAPTNWRIMDTARDPINPTASRLCANLSSADPCSDSEPLDILSNGFKIRATSSDENTSADTYIYAAFADVPFYYSAQPAASAVSNAGTSFLMGMTF